MAALENFQNVDWNFEMLNVWHLIDESTLWSEIYYG